MNANISNTYSLLDIGLGNMNKSEHMIVMAYKRKKSRSSTRAIAFHSLMMKAPSFSRLFSSSNFISILCMIFLTSLNCFSSPRNNEWWAGEFWKRVWLELLLSLMSESLLFSSATSSAVSEGRMLQISWFARVPFVLKRLLRLRCLLKRNESKLLKQNSLASKWIVICKWEWFEMISNFCNVNACPIFWLNEQGKNPFCKYGW